MIQYPLNSSEQMMAFSQQLAPNIKAGQVVFLEGDLGAGKTTLVKGLLAAWGYAGVVTSPTFTLLESYDLADFSAHHFDLYRMESAEELEMIGARDLFNTSSICLLEWPQKAAGFLPQPDLTIVIEYVDQGRVVRLLGQGFDTLNLNWNI
ncbi:MAG: tRNA (adenosine(37)-N6)-threonylcarbamoyltransferase complex ATPase subunit type 1 TsaE [Arenicellales bacterium]